MIFELVVEPSGARDIADADAHYAQFDKADTFLSAIDVVFEQLTSMPLMYRQFMATSGDPTSSLSVLRLLHCGRPSSLRARNSPDLRVLPDIRDTLLDSALAAMSIRPKEGLDGHGAHLLAMSPLASRSGPERRALQRRHARHAVPSREGQSDRTTPTR
jgi:hypothetical protein